MIISVEGNIGAGKSTMLKILKDKYHFNSSNVIFLQEPLEEWLNLTDASNKNILEYFYEKSDRWSYSFQMHAFITRAKKIMEQNNHDTIIIVERSVLTDRNVFAKLLYRDGKINEIEWKLYNEWYSWLISDICRNITPDIYIYLKCSPETAFKRIQQRGRSEENTITYDYIEAVNKMHDDWLGKEENNSVITIDVEYDISDMEYHDQIISNVASVINTHLREQEWNDMDNIVNIISCAS